MRPLWKDILAAIWLGVILPGIVLNAFVIKEKHRENKWVQTQQVQTVQDTGHFIPVLDADQELVYMNLNDYLTGVLLAEIPAEFHEEALKAQAVAARTYAWKSYTTGGKHGDSSICTDAACCQAYISNEIYLEKGGTSDHIKKIRQAVQDTSDFVLAYDGELIEATYFSSSGGSTEAAMAVWGTDFPYLRAVSSPEEVSVYMVSYTQAEFQNLLGRSLSKRPSEWIDSVTYTEGGGVASIDICGETYSGTEIRTLLGLRSTDFDIQTDGPNITVTTRGYGHRVGMSQYGANAMAESGRNWQKILQHYYPGTTLFPIS